VGVLLGGAALRGALMEGWQPAFMGWPDAKSYIDVAHGSLFGNVLRPAGYPLLVWLLDLWHPTLAWVVAVNHLFGLATAAVLFAVIWRAGAPPALGLVAAAVVALNGDTAFVEHSPLSEPLFTLLVAVALYGAVRTLRPVGLGWPLAVGALLAYATTVRVVGAVLLPVFGAWLLFASSGPLRRRARTAGLAAVAVVAVLGAYTVAEEASVGAIGLSRHGAWHLYARVAGFADCSRFTPPPGTRVLCDDAPRAVRGTVDEYLFQGAHSPAYRAFGDPFSSSPQHVAAIGSFARAAIVHQPLDYLREVGGDTLRYVAPDAFRRYGGGPSYADLVGAPILRNPLYGAQGLWSVRAYYGWGPGGFIWDPPVFRPLLRYESATRVEGPLFVVLALLSLSAPFVLRGRPRAAALLLTLTAWALLVAPVATLEFSARSALPGFGMLAGAASLGAWGWARALRRVRVRVPVRA
jgi:hypothetical protein